MGKQKTLLFFPTAACRCDDGGWQIPVHGWIYRATELSRLRRAGLGLARRYVQLRHRAAATELANFTQRFGSFLSDNERNERVSLQIAGETFALKKSQSNGHIHATLSLKKCSAPEGWLHFIATQRNLTAITSGKTLLLPQQGISVISDIDDTIKVSNVQKKRELLRNTFGRPFACVPGMAALYRSWERTLGASFHYVSASPWHLFPFLSEFLHAQDFPEGTWHLRDFRLLGRDIVQTFQSSRRVKIRHIAALLHCYPHRRFILVGDSGERDAEIYGRIARDLPDQVHAIFIRNVTGESPTDLRWQKAFAGIPSRSWKIFTDVAEIAGDAITR